MKTSVAAVMIVLILQGGLLLAQPVDDNTLAYWKLDEGTGTFVEDSSPYGNNGTVENAIWTTDAKTGGFALEFNGVDSQVVVPDSPTLHTQSGDMTIGAWIKVFSDPKGWSSAGAIVFKGGAYQWAVDTNGNLWFGIWGGALKSIGTYDFTEHLDEWHHVAATFELASQNAVLYVDGEINIEGTIAATIDQTTNELYLGLKNDGGAHFDGIIDEVRISDVVRTQDEIKASMTGTAALPKARGPNPPDGSILEATWANLSWKPGDFAVTHDVYIGTNFDDVNDGTGDTYQGKQDGATLIVGFFGFPIPDGLVPGTTYYWRIDEVNDANAASPWKGDTWSFTVPSRTAYDPRPADGAKFAEPDVVLSWTPGFGGKLHTVYFGDDPDEVSNATGGIPQPDASYTPGTLEFEKVYYWRVDEFDGTTIHKGQVWSFTTTGQGGGLKAEYFNNTTLSGDPLLTRVDPVIDFDWSNGDVPGENSPDASINVDYFGARWTGELEVDLTDTYTFSINANNGFRLWLDGKPIINYWTNPTTSRRESDPIELIGGQTYSIRMDYFEGNDVAIAQLFWQSSTRDEQIIPAGALKPLSKAGDPNPYNGATDVTQVILPSWLPGEDAASHQIYFGTDAEAVKNATPASPEYQGSKAAGEESFDPGKLAWNTVYYWRVDEINNSNPASPWTGKVWSFRTADFLIVEDFESYNDLNPEDPGSKRIFDAWIDGFGTTTNGALVGNDAAPFMELTNVHGGFQSLPYSYDNNLKTSEATLTLSFPSDWTEGGVTKLSLWFRGNSANAPERMFVALNGNAVVYNDDPAAAQTARWTEWIIDLQDFAAQGVNLANVSTITIGFGTKGSPAAGGTGLVLFDDIRLD